uniref:Uncharacterized protein n=1 Tax=Meloidogyne incognita TaxID=6306 RepID=A0A914KXK0_MELIC
MLPRIRKSFVRKSKYFFFIGDLNDQTRVGSGSRSLFRIPIPFVRRDPDPA